MPDYLNTLSIQGRRVWNSAKYGMQQAISSYRQEDFVAEIDFEWDSQPARMARYWHNRRYVDNTIYSAINRYANTFKHKEKLYQHIKGIYNPVARLVGIESAKVMGGVINYESFDSGAFLIANADDRELEAIRTILYWSNWETKKTRFTRGGAAMGDIALKIVDDLERKEVRLEVLDPRKVSLVLFDAVGAVKYCEIEYEKQDPVTGEWYTYKERISDEWFYFYRNGSPYNYLDMRHVNTPEESGYPNPYGFVPLVWTQHQDVGLDFGSTSWHNSRHKIDLVNDALSLTLANLRMMVNTKYAVFGAKVPRAADGSPTTMAVTTDRQDQAPFIEFPSSSQGANGAIEPIVYPVPITEALAFAASQIKEIESDLPQLALYKMREETGNLSGVAIENLYNDSVDTIGETQANYLASLETGLQMAMSIGAYRGYAEFAGYTVDSYQAKSIRFDIRPKSLFADKLSLEKQIALTIQAAESDASSLLLPKLDYDEKQIQEFENIKADNAAAAIRGVFEGSFGKPDMQEREKRLAERNSQNSATMDGNEAENEDYE